VFPPLALFDSFGIDIARLPISSPDVQALAQWLLGVVAVLLVALAVLLT
jgi:hypothetical protein